MLVKPMIDSWEVPRIARIASGESRRLSFLSVPGLTGDLSQDLGRGALVVEISGSLYGDEARDEFLKKLRQSFLAGGAVDFIADIVNESELEKVLVESLDLEENATNPDECFYRIRLCEYTEPPEPPALASDFGADLAVDLDLEAQLGLDLLDLPSLPSLPGLPVTLPKLGDALAPLKPAAQTLRSTVAQASTLLEPLDNLLGMIEQALLDSLEALATGLALTPAPKLIGVIEPVADTELPALVVAIEQSQRLSNGLGERSTLVTNGALAWQAVIDLANPVLPAEPSFSLVSADRKQLILPHGGLVRLDSSTGPLGAADIQVTVQGQPRVLTQAAPGPTQFSADPLSGTLAFGQALPPNGIVEAHYFLGQWEQRVVRSNGVLRLAVLAADAATVRDLSNSVLAALVDSTAVLPPGLSDLTITEIGSVGSADPPLATVRRRVVRLRFEFEQQINVPDSSGGIIQRIPITGLLA